MKDEIPKWIRKEICSCIKKKFTGKLTLNFYEGGVANYDETKHVKAPEKKKV